MVKKKFKKNTPTMILIFSLIILLATKLFDFQFTLLVDLSLTTLAILGLFIGGIWLALEYFKII